MTLKTLKVTVDRIEKDKAVLISDDTRRSHIISLELLPKGVKEGDVLAISAEFDKEATERRRKETSALIDKLSRKDRNKLL